MPKSLKGEHLDWFKVRLDLWGLVAPPDKDRFPSSYKDDVYLDIGTSSRSVRNLYFQTGYATESGGFATVVSGVDPVLDHHLTTKGYVDTEIAAASGTTMAAIQAYMAARGIPRMLKTIMASGHRAAEIVENMLSFARKSDTLVSSHNIIDLLERTLDLAATDYDLKKQHDFKQIKIIREYEEDLPPLPCEKQKIQQVVLNIFRNSAEAMHSVTDRQPRLILRVEAEPEMARIEIEDNGPGMDEKTRRRVLEPFFTTKSSGVGTGLGLSVSYFIITENHGGTMAVDSTPGIGSRFIIRLPWKRKPDA